MNNVFFAETATDAQYDFTIHDSKKGPRTLKIGNYYVESKYDPLKEAERFAQQHFRKNHVHVLFGLGLGYAAVQLAKKLSNKDILLIVEPSKALFDQIREADYVTELFSNERVFFFIGWDKEQFSEEVKYIVSASILGQVQYLISPNYNKLYPNEVNTIKDTILENMKLALVNFNTVNAFSKMWQQNMFHNLKHSQRVIPFSKLKNSWNKPIVVASAGPSLTKQLPLLKEYKERKQILLIASGSAVNTLLNHHIVPDVVVSIDGAEANWHHFKEIANASYALFYSLTVHSDIPKHHKGPKVLFNVKSEPVLTRWIDDIFQTEMGDVHGGASVATFALSIACQLTQEPVMLIGQDLAYTNNQSHAEGNKGYKVFDEKHYQDKQRYLKIKGYYEEDVTTDYSLFSMKRVIEDIVIAEQQANPNRLIYNCTEGGAFIQHVENAPFQAVLEEHCVQGDEHPFFNNLSQLEMSPAQYDQMLINLLKEQAEMKSVLQLSQEAMTLCKEYEEGKNDDIDALLEQLNNADQEMMGSLKNNIIYYSSMSYLFQIEYQYQEPDDETEDEQKARILKKSKALYEAVYDMCDESLRMLEKTLQEPSL